MKIVLGHKKPDTDSVCSSIVYSEIAGGEARVIGGINDETAFALKKFGYKKPEEWKGEGDEFVLIDHNEAEQSINSYEQVVEIIDHHKINLKTEMPIKVLIEPLGSTCTIIAKNYSEKINEKNAGLLLSGILSDTVVFKSPTTTQEDIDIANELGEKLGIDPEEYGVKLKKAATNIKGKTPKQLIQKDYKEYTFQNKKFFIGQVEVADLKTILKMKNDLLTEMKKMKYDVVLLMLTDIIKKETELLIIGSEKEVAGIFNKEVVENAINLPGVLSRKKQIVPQITKHYS